MYENENIVASGGIRNKTTTNIRQILKMHLLYVFIINVWERI